MNNGSNPFGDVDVFAAPVPQQPYSPTDEILDQLEPAPVNEIDQEMAEALNRIERASLYQTLCSASLFAEGSAKPEIQQQVEAEIREFAMKRMRTLVGIGSDRDEVRQPPAALPFSDEEVEALKGLAARVLQKAAEPASTPAPRQPQIVPVNAPAKTVRPVEAKVSTKAVAKPSAGTRPASRPAAPPPTQKARSRKRSQNVGEHQDKDYSQAVPSEGPAPKVLDRASFQMAESTKAHTQMESLVQNDALSRAIVAKKIQ